MEYDYNNFVSCAKGLPGFIVGQKEDVPYDITELMNGYCQAKDAQDQTKTAQYLSALYVRYWHVLVWIYQQSKFARLEFEDIIYWFYEAFEKAAYYRSWLDDNKEISKNSKGAEKCINQCITSVRQWWYKHYNQDKRKINYLTSSLDEYLPGTGPDDAPTTILDNVVDEDENCLLDQGKLVIQNFIDKGRVFEAIVLDGVLYQDSFIDSTTVESMGVDNEGNEVSVTKYHSDFSPSKLKRYLRNINVDIFSSTYTVDKEQVNSIAENIKTLTKAQLAKKVDKAFNSFRNNKEIRAWLCM